MASGQPTDAPPSYESVTGKKSFTNRPQDATASSSAGGGADPSHLQVPGSKNKTGISPADRRSMEDEGRPLPQGWVRSYDQQSNHQFFVDTTKEPPRSIWHHPYDDEEYLATLTSEQRERIEHESLHGNHEPSHNDYIFSHSDVEDDSHPTSGPSKSGNKIPSELPPRPGGSGSGSGSNAGKGKAPEERSFGRKLKDKVTGTTHAEREQQRARRAEEERKYWEQHQALRRAMVEAARTGRPVLLGKDERGQDVYVEPPPVDPYYGRGAAGYPGGGYGYNPYAPPGGVYSTPNARYIRPAGPYGRPMGRGFGGGYGLPLAVGGGLLGGMLIGDMMF